MEHARQPVAQHLIAHAQLDILDHNVKVCMEYSLRQRRFWLCGCKTFEYEFCLLIPENHPTGRQVQHSLGYENGIHSRKFYDYGTRTARLS